MYKINDTILYGTQGVCQITGTTEKKIDGKAVRYYVLKPVYQSNSTIFVPVGNEKLTSKMRRVLSAGEIYDLIRTMPVDDFTWISDDNERKQEFQRIVENGDRRELVRLIKTIYIHKQKQMDCGRKLHLCDERIYKQAEKLLYDEFALVLNIQPDQVMSFILDKIGSDLEEPERRAE